MAISLKKLLSTLEAIAPLELAEDWDNVGLLVEPTKPRKISRVFLTIDLTEHVLDEALRGGADAVIAYHPPIFGGLQRLTRRTSGERIVVRSIEAGLAVYSPHTALDAAGGGVNDWLADGLGEGARQALEPKELSSDVEDSVSEGRTVIGQGRVLELERAATLTTIVGRVKKHLGLAKVRVARAPEHRASTKLSSIALCAGAGGSVICGVEADVYWTGEMRHHDVLAANAQGRSVILCDHTNTERGYLAVLRKRLVRELGRDVKVGVSRRDRDPLEII